MTDRAPKLYDEDGGERELPWRWEICSRCEGHGKSSAYLGAFTRDDLDEAGEEFCDDYFAGRFDRPCGHCCGGRVRVLDRDRVSKNDAAEYDRQQQEIADCDAEHHAERLFEGGWREEGWFEP